MERATLKGFNLYYGKDGNCDRVLGLFVAYLIETKRITGYEDEQKQWVKLSDLLKYKGYFIPDIGYGFSGESRVRYYYEILLNNIPRWLLVEESTGLTLEYILTNTLSYFEENRGRTTADKIKYYMESSEARYDISTSEILDWLTPAKNPKAIDAIGSVEFNMFAASDENNITYIEDSDVSGYGGATEHTWELLHGLLKELGVQKLVFNGNEAYNVHKPLFRVLGKDKYVLRTMDENKELNYVRPYEMSNGLYEFFNPAGHVKIKQQYFICKDCGQMFKLYNDEIDFFNRKNLHIPGRCIKCRKGLPHPDWDKLLAEKIAREQ